MKVTDMKLEACLWALERHSACCGLRFPPSAGLPPAVTQSASCHLNPAGGQEATVLWC